MPPEPAGILSGAPMLLSMQTAETVNPDFNPFVSLLILFLLILVNAFFAASEIAIITLNDNKIRKMAEDGDKKAEKILRLTENSSRFLSTIQIGVTLSGFLTSASASQSFAAILAEKLSFLPISTSLLHGVSTVLITIILSYFSLVLGELVPKKIAMQKAEALSFRFIGILSATASIFSVFISFLTVSTNFVLKLLGLDPNTTEDTVTEEEILMMVDVGEEKGLIIGSAKDMIENIFDFADTTVEEIMTHRTDVGAVEDTSSISDVVALAIEEGYSRIPVFHEDLDTILGIIYVKDLLKYVGSEINSSVKITDLMRPAYFVPETKRCTQLFTEMTENKVQIAVIVDEYGGTSGIITMEDLLEAIVGNIQDEFDDEEEEIRRVSDNSYTVEGSTSIDEISDLVGVDLPEGDYDTIAGLVVENLGRIPKPGEHPTVRVQNLALTVQEVEENRISRLLIVKDLTPPPPEGQSGDKNALSAKANSSKEHHHHHHLSSFIDTES